MALTELSLSLSLCTKEDQTKAAAAIIPEAVIKGQRTACNISILRGKEERIAIQNTHYNIIKNKG